MNTILPNDFDILVQRAVQQFWNTRLSSNVSTQEGSRGSVIGGKNLDGFSSIIKAVSQHCGAPDDCIITTGKKALTIPGFFRPTKMWDAIVIYKGRLIACFELKSQVGSFGNNFNNRTEESIGSATDFWTAFREKAFDIENFKNSTFQLNTNTVVKRPFLGYLMLLEKCNDSTCAVKVEEENFKIFKEFHQSSYSKRYQLLCEKLVIEGLYSSASLILSDKINGLNLGEYNSPTDSLSPRSLFADFAGQLLSVLETY